MADRPSPSRCAQNVRSDTDRIVHAARREEQRVCAVCGRPLEGKRAHARFHEARCRALASRITSVLSPSGNGQYRSLAEMLSVATPSTLALLGISPEQPPVGDGSPDPREAPYPSKEIVEA